MCALLTDNEQHTCVFLRSFIKKESTIMQKSKLQNILFTIVMAFVMVYAMVC